MTNPNWVVIPIKHKLRVGRRWMLWIVRFGSNTFLLKLYRGEMFESLFFWKEERITKLLRLIHLDVSGTYPQHNTAHVV